MLHFMHYPFDTTGVKKKEKKKASLFGVGVAKYMEYL